MRIGSVSALVFSAFALAACTGAETSGNSTLATLDIAPCSLDTCPPLPGDTPDPNAVDPNADGNDSSSDGGNTTNLTPITGDTTIALETSKILKPNSGTSLSLLTAGTSPLTTTAQILSGTKPTKLTIAIDTKTSSNGTWPTPVQMNEYVPGTTAVDPTGHNNGGAGAGYREYRAYSTEPGKERDESLQVWAWTDAYATQYRNTPNGGEAANQAWSFGGNKTALAAMPGGGSATYNGRFVGTAKTANYKKPDGATIDPNALWRVEGASALTANFGAGGTVNGTLTPETWTSFQDGISATYMQPIVPLPGPFVPGNGLTLVEAPNYSFYHTTVALKGTITGNTYAGTADLSGAFISGDSTMYGGFFNAAGPAETAGVFHDAGMDPYPVGGSAGINGDTRGFLTIDGAFHGTCTSGVGACP